MRSAVDQIKELLDDVERNYDKKTVAQVYERVWVFLHKYPIPKTPQAKCEVQRLKDHVALLRAMCKN